MHLVVYMSDYNPEAGDINTVIQDIALKAKPNNLKHNVTGVLIYLEGKFLQAIEAEKSTLDQLIINISKDNRHTNFEILIDTPIESRTFRNWSLDTLLLGQNQKFDQETIKTLTKSFEQNFLPRADILFYFYKALLKEDVVKPAHK